PADSYRTAFEISSSQCIRKTDGVAARQRPQDNHHRPASAHHLREFPPHPLLHLMPRPSNGGAVRSAPATAARNGHLRIHRCSRRGLKSSGTKGAPTARVLTRRFFSCPG